MIEIRVADLEAVCAELKTTEAVNDFRLQAEQILLNAKREVMNALEDAKVRERDIMARRNADEVARQLNAYREAGIDEEKSLGAGPTAGADGAVRSHCYGRRRRMKTPEEIKKGLEYCGHAIGCFDCIYFDGNECEETLEDDALAYIHQLEAQVPKWISVNEQLPEDGVDVIIHTDFRGGYVGCGYYRIVRDAWFTSLGILLASNVLHWRPLPGMPKED